MHIINDFFLLNWNEKAELIDDLDIKFSKQIDFNDNFDDFCDSASILLIINSENIEQILEIKAVKEIFNGIFENIFLERYLILQTQKELLKYLIELGDIELIKNIKSRFEILRKEGVITYFVSRRLIGLLSLIKEKEISYKRVELKKAEKGENYFKNFLSIIKTAIKNLKEVLELEDLLDRVDEISKKLDMQKFSIGVTGVMNSGKSTMLNALLQREILGTATIPETANLTLLKYSKTEFARVNFWKKSEFERIEKSAQNSEKIKQFIEETKSHFGNELGKYITKSGNSKEIDITELVFYTSAKKSDKKANLVKSVELYSSLEFLKEGVEIVDTPGLDDPIIQREEITLEYLKDCDLMCHLMNVHQSATKKDVDFIINSILYQSIPRVLILITRIDTVSKSELQEVIEYVKESIKKRLLEHNKENKLDSIIKKIEFLPLSAKMALLHRTNRADEALKKGYSLEKTGILKFEEYLKNTLFGEESPKANLMLDSSLREIDLIIKNSKKRFNDEVDLLQKSSHQLKKESIEFKEKKERILSYISEVKKAIKEGESDIKEYIKVLDKFVDERLNLLADMIKRRVLDDISYELRKNKKLPKKERIDYILSIGLKDGLVDLVRDYKYEFQKRLSENFQGISVRFKELELETQDDFKFDTKDFFEKNFKTFISFTQKELLSSSIDEVIKKFAKKDLQMVESHIYKLLRNDIEEMKLDIEDKLEIINRQTIKEYIEQIKEPLRVVEEDIKSKEKAIENALNTLHKSSRYKKERLACIDSKMIALKEIEEVIKGAMEGIR